MYNLCALEFTLVELFRVLHITISICFSADDVCYLNSFQKEVILLWKMNLYKIDYHNFSFDPNASISMKHLFLCKKTPECSHLKNSELHKGFFRCKSAIPCSYFQNKSESNVEKIKKNRLFARTIYSVFIRRLCVWCLLSIVTSTHCDASIEWWRHSAINVSYSNNAHRSFNLSAAHFQPLWLHKQCIATLSLVFEIT